MVNSVLKKHSSEKVFDVCNITLMLMLCLIFIIPILYIVTGSLISNEEFLRRGYVLFPEKLDFGAYRYVLNLDYGLYRAFKDTAIITLLGTFLNLVVTSAMAYGLAKKTMPGRNVITGMVFITMLFNGGMIPTFLVVRGTGLLNTYLAFIIPTLVSPWNLFLLRNFFMSIPVSLEESAMLDGANEVEILLRIILPLSLPSIATIGLFYAVAHWNVWFEVLIYVPKYNIKTIQYVLREIFSNNIQENIPNLGERMVVPPHQIRMATLVVATVPILIVYPFIQKYFVKGVMVGSIKG